MVSCEEGDLGSRPQRKKRHYRRQRRELLCTRKRSAYRIQHHTKKVTSAQLSIPVLNLERVVGAWDKPFRLVEEGSLLMFERIPSPPPTLEPPDLIEGNLGDFPKICVRLHRQLSSNDDFDNFQLD
jgi:hypothetical protein